MSNIRLIIMPWGFEIHRRVVDNDPKSLFKQFGAGVGMTIEHHLGRELAPQETASIITNNYVDIA